MRPPARRRLRRRIARQDDKGAWTGPQKSRRKVPKASPGRKRANWPGDRTELSGDLLSSVRAFYPDDRRPSLSFRYAWRDHADLASARSRRLRSQPGLRWRAGVAEGDRFGGASGGQPDPGGGDPRVHPVGGALPPSWGPGGPSAADGRPRAAAAREKATPGAKGVGAPPVDGEAGGPLPANVSGRRAARPRQSTARPEESPAPTAARPVAHSR